MSKAIDLNLDAGESESDLKSGHEEKLYRLVSSVNIACGGHAGTEATMREAVGLAMKHGLAIGAHPSFPDREGFGRRVISMAKSDLIASLVEQMRSLQKVCVALGARLRHVKPHGALYNAAAKDEELASTILEAVSQVDPGLIVVGLSGSSFLAIAEQKGFKVAGEAFVDRRYESDGSLRARQNMDALITEPEVAAEQAVALALGREVQAVGDSHLQLAAQTLCIHGDSPNSLSVAQAVRSALNLQGIAVRPLA